MALNQRSHPARAGFSGAILACCFAWPCAALAADSKADVEALAFFEKKIRPVLVEKCYECHSADAEKIKGGLRVDTSEGLRAGGDSGPALEPGHPGKSLVLAAIGYEDPDLEMPPKERLPKAVVDDFVRWIEMGAPDPRTGPAGAAGARRIDIEASRGFWAFRAPSRAAVPEIDGASASTGAIDRFLAAAMRERGVAPVGEAARRDLLRRVTFDLTGLPPSPEEIRDFLSDESGDAFAKVVDRLLASRQYAEHWARHWLDLARYADSNGGDINLTFRNAWRYRNYVIESFHRDKPYDRFIREQIAGDLLPARDNGQRGEQLVATGFLVIGPKMLSERDKEKMHLDIADEQIDTVGRAFMGLTLGCARCHDHKFDPVPTSDYYALAGIFLSTVTAEGIRMDNVNVSGWIERELPMDANLAAATAAYRTTKAGIETALKAREAELEALQKAGRDGESELRGTIVDNTEAELHGFWADSTHSPNFVGVGYIHDEKEGKGAKSVVYTPDLPRAGVYEVRLSYAHNTGRSGVVPVMIACAEGKKRVTVDQETRPAIGGLWEALGRFEFKAGREGSVTISTEGTEDGYVIADAVQFLSVEELDRAEVEAPEKEASGARLKIAAATKAVKELEQQLKEIGKEAPQVPMTMAAEDRGEPADCAIRVRGEAGNRGEPVPRGFLTVASSPGGAAAPIAAGQSGRRELADWIASPENPLTARVMVNRIWQHLFGEGIVRTVDNFGELGDRPSHPALLDHLALEFVDSGWSVKTIVREIAMSAAYRRSTDHSEQSHQADPENRLLWRQNRRVLPAESLRDAILAASGSLDRAPAESAVDDLAEQAISNSADQAGGSGVKDHRKRSIYLPLVRSDMPDFLEIFDVANPEMVTGQRAVTTVPSQALLLMNSPFVRDEARRMAENLVGDETLDDRARLERAYALALARRPSEEEAARAMAFLGEAGNPSENGARSAMTEAWAELCHVLFASTEFRFLN